MLSDKFMYSEEQTIYRIDSYLNLISAPYPTINAISKAHCPQAWWLIPQPLLTRKRQFLVVFDEAEIIIGQFCPVFALFYVK